jgi:flagellar hook assembly protein FlgD
MAGSHSVTWDGVDENGRSVGTGTYLYRLRTGTQQHTRKMLLVK